MRVLITGGAGFIGSHTADRLLAAGHQVRALDLLDPQIHGPGRVWPASLDPGVERMLGDVGDLQRVLTALDGVDAVVHCAALTGVGQSLYDIRHYVDTNTTGTATLIEAILKRGQPLPRLVLSSSRAVYGEGTHRCAAHGPCNPPTRDRRDLEQGRFGCYCPTCGAAMQSVPTAEDQPAAPLSVYAWTKRHQEDLCGYAARTYGIPVTILRYFNVYGSRQSLANPYTGVVSVFYSRLLAGQAISLYEGGEPLRDFVHIQDVVTANLLALRPDLPTGMVFNIGSGGEVSIRQVALALMAATGRRVELLDRGEFRVGDIHACCADLRRATEHLGYRPAISLTQGLEEFVAWAASQPMTDRYEQTVDELTRYNLFGRARPAMPDATPDPGAHHA
ncbi:NAD-dependent epimerase/dehydratase family protein [Candidatus Thiodictyon syntrophicum]|jgi:dTDP-L-rhamnose 4-epimerase|uniref:NAD-dependent dehydratase n=1 Tax=Candidatus Thiodictyon syntrophicum TaxID=1166950 RepID=A0A2K8U697_9GAMM|nr:NAD-dependent epimerase/dehydratase family protein [Candidatus Thiodictyon syntrophicum]AUB80929.1 NAD-dependent dehydratase [Candidatus Thiodictyon syntrophicum]